MPNEIVFARRTSVLRLDADSAQEFLSENHRAGKLKTSTAVRNIGLSLQGEVIAVAQFGYPRTTAMRAKYSTELYRLAFKRDFRIPGGASKLIKYYISQYKPSDLFTYQDTSGEATAVYEHAGMTLVSQAKRKQYLVAPGKTLETGSRKEVLGMPYATRFGPDRILGTNLGEIYREDGSRKSNKDIFLEDLGWHIEETSGDRVYEWVDPNRTYYTYKITASDSDKYYYGVSHVKKANATTEDCLNDGYWGSGGLNSGNKFRNWKIRHRGTLKKEVLQTYSRKSSGFLAKKRLIDDSWRTDELCLNSRPGGATGGFEPTGKRTTEKDCPSHGRAKHLRGKCLKCIAADRNSMSLCLIHGETLHSGRSCIKCSNSSTITVEECPSHGEAKFQSGVCYSCRNKDLHRKLKCLVHGETIHRGGSCLECIAEKKVSRRECPKHGLTKHTGTACYKCFVENSYEEKECPRHGLTIHRGGSCSRCSSKDRYGEKFCLIHGKTTFSGDNCVSCSNAAVVTVKNCPVHGMVKHQGTTCVSCSSKKLIAMKDCPRHGMTKHRGKSCYRCAGEKRKDRTSSVK